MSRILITGGSSYLGQHLVPLAVKSLDYEICYTFYQTDPVNQPIGRRLNILDETAVLRLVRQFQPDVIIHTVGSNQGLDMERVIRQGTSHITHAAVASNARLIHLSTDVIFDGLDAPYDETAKPSPITEYGRAKAGAETSVGKLPNHVIVRTSLIYGLLRMDRGTSWMANALRARQPIRLFSDQRRNPVWITSLSQACLELASNDYVGILNVAGKQALSRADFAIKMLDWWEIEERSTVTVGPALDGKWPLDCELDIELATTILNTPLWGVDEVLKRNSPDEYRPS